MTEPTWGGESKRKQLAVPEPKHFCWADKLAQAIKNKVRFYNRTKSAEWFARLLRMLNNDEARLEQVLEWYTTKGIKGIYAVQAWCGRSFCQKFDKVEAAMNRDQVRNPVVTIGVQAQNIVIRLIESHDWSNRQDLGTAVQCSLNVLHNLKDKLPKLCFILPQQKKLAMFVAHLLNSDELTDPGWFVFNWFRDLRKWIGQKGYSGPLLPRSISLTNAQFITHMEYLAADYHDASLWHELMEAIK